MFCENQYYHVYNQGNNRRKLFFTEADYELFRFKLMTYVQPFAKIYAYCLMPNHYHLFVKVMHVSLKRKSMIESVENFQRKYLKSRGVAGRISPVRINPNFPNDISLSDSIAIIQRSYSRAINHKKNWSGSMFRSKFKINDGFKDTFLGVHDREFFDDMNFIHNIVDYIHQNPPKDLLCLKPEDWTYSSARFYKENMELNGDSVFRLFEIPI